MTLFTEHRPGGKDHDQKDHGRRGTAAQGPAVPAPMQPRRPWWEMRADEFAANYPEYVTAYGATDVMGLVRSLDTWMTNSARLEGIVSKATWDLIPADMKDVRWTTLDRRFERDMDVGGVSDFRFKVPPGGQTLDVPPLMMLNPNLFSGGWYIHDGDFTVAHELGHIAFGRKGLSPLSRHESEQFANLYAERLLGRFTTRGGGGPAGNLDNKGAMYTVYGDQVLEVTPAVKAAASVFFPESRQPYAKNEMLRLMALMSQGSGSATKRYLAREAEVAASLGIHVCEHGVVFVTMPDEVETESELLTEHIFPPPSAHGPGDPQLTHGRYKGGPRTRIGVAPGEGLQKDLGRGWTMAAFAIEDPEAYRIIHDSGLTIERMTVGRGYWSEGQQKSEYDLDLVLRGNPELAELVARSLQDHWQQSEVLAWHFDGKGKVPTASFRLAEFVSGSETQVDLERVMAKHAPDGWRMSFDTMGNTRQVFFSRAGDSDSASFLDRVKTLHEVLAREGYIRGHSTGPRPEDETGISEPIMRAARLVSFRDGKRKVWTEGSVFARGIRGGHDDARHGVGPPLDPPADGEDGRAVEPGEQRDTAHIQRFATKFAEGLAELLTEHILPPPSQHGPGQPQKVHGRTASFKDDPDPSWREGRDEEIAALLNDPDIVRARALLATFPRTILDNSPARLALRHEVADLIYGDGAPRQERIAYVVMGLPAMGKSSLAEPLAERLGALVVKGKRQIATDSDTAKEFLMNMDAKKDMVAAGAYHEEADLILKRVMRKAVKNGDNIVLPAVGKTPKSMRDYIEKLKKYDYEVHIVHLSGDPVQSVKNSVRRFKSSPEHRYVEPKYILNGVGRRPDATFDILVKEGRATSYERFDVKVHASADRKRTFYAGERGRGLGHLPESRPSGNARGRTGRAVHPGGNRPGRGRLSEGQEEGGDEGDPEEDWITPKGHDRPFTDEFEVVLAHAQKEFEEPTARGIGKVAEVGALRNVLGPVFERDLGEVLDMPLIFANRVNGQPLDGAAMGEVDGKPALVLNPLAKDGLRALLAQAVRLRDERRLDKNAQAGDLADGYADAMASRFTEHLGPGPHPSGSEQAVHGKKWWEMSNEEAVGFDPFFEDPAALAWLGSLREAFARSVPITTALSGVDPRLADTRLTWLDPEKDLRFATALGLPGPDEASAFAGPSMGRADTFPLESPPLIVAWKGAMDGDEDFILAHELGHVAAKRMPEPVVAEKKMGLAYRSHPGEVAANMFAERMLGRSMGLHTANYGGNVVAVPDELRGAKIPQMLFDDAWRAGKPDRKVSAALYDGRLFTNYGGVLWEVRPEWMGLADYWFPDKPHPRVRATKVDRQFLDALKLRPGSYGEAEEVATGDDRIWVCEFGAVLMLPVQQTATEAVIDVRPHLRSRGGKPFAVRGHQRKLPDIRPAPIFAPFVADKSIDPAFVDAVNKAQSLIGGPALGEDHTEIEEHAGLIKRQNVLDVTELMENDPALREVPRGYGDETMGKTIARFVDERQRDWAETSSDKAYRQVALQYTVAEEFGLDSAIINDTLSDEQGLKVNPDAVWTLSQEAVKIQAADYYMDNAPMLHSYVRAVYQNTQQKLAAAGLDSVILTRGMTNYIVPGDTPEQTRAMNPLFLVGKAGTTAERTVKMNPLSSWSAELFESKKFASTGAGYHSDTDAVVLGARVPASRVWSTAVSGPGCWKEFEYIVLGGASAKVTVEKQ